MALCLTDEYLTCSAWPCHAAQLLYKRNLFFVMELGFNSNLDHMPRERCEQLHLPAVIVCLVCPVF